MALKINRSYFDILIFILMLLILFNTYYFWFYGAASNILALICIIFLLLNRSTSKICFQNIISSSFVVLLFFYVNFPRESGILVVPILHLAGFILVSILRPNFLVVAFDKFFLVLSILLIPSIIYYFAIVFGYDLSYERYYLKSGNELSGDNYYRIYIGATFLNHVIYDLGAYRLPRLLGIFDEPGYLGTVCALYLSVNKYSILNFRNLIIFIAGLLSMSLAFYLLSMLYYIITALLFSRWKQLFALLIFCVSASLVLITLKIELPIVSRIVSVSENPNAIDNRASESFDLAFEDFLAGDEQTILFGKGNAAHVNLGLDVSSIKTLFFNSGIMGCVLISLFYFYNFLIIKFRYYKFDHRSAIVFFGLYILSAYQRPDVLATQYFMLFVYGINKFGCADCFDEQRGKNEFLRSDRVSSFLRLRYLS